MIREGDEERKREAEERKKSWELLREAIKYLKENDKNWTERRVKEAARIRAEEKRERDL